MNFLVSSVINDILDVFELVDLVQFIHILSQHLLSVEFLLSFGHRHTSKVLKLYFLKSLHVLDVLGLFALTKRTHHFFWAVIHLFLQHLDVVVLRELALSMGLFSLDLLGPLLNLVLVHDGVHLRRFVDFFLVFVIPSFCFLLWGFFRNLLWFVLRYFTLIIIAVVEVISALSTLLILLVTL